MSSGNGRNKSLSFELPEDPQRPATSMSASDSAASLLGTPELVFDLEGPEGVGGGEGFEGPEGPAEGFAPYRGPLGQTRQRAVRVRRGGALVSVEVVVAIDADADPDLARRARGELAAPLHALMLAGEPIDLAIPFIYHEPSRALLALVLPPELRHREIEERIELLRQLQLEPDGISIPQYVLQFDVVIGSAGLSAWRAYRQALPARAAPARRAAAPQTPSAPAAAPASAALPAPSAPSAPIAPIAPTISEDAATRRGPRTFGPANAQALHTIHGISPSSASSSASIPLPSFAGSPGSGGLSAIPAYTAEGTDGADATAATVSPMSLEPLSGGITAAALSRAPASSAPLASPAPAPAPAAASPMGAASAFSSPVPGPVLGPHSGPSSGPVTAAEPALESAPRHLRAPSSHDLGLDQLPSQLPSQARSPARSFDRLGSRDDEPVLIVEAPVLPSRAMTPMDPPYLSASRTRTIENAFDRIMDSGDSNDPGGGSGASDANNPGDPADAARSPAERTTDRSLDSAFDPAPLGASAESGFGPRERTSPPEPEAPVGDVSATPDTIDEDLSAGLSRAVRELPPESDPLTTEAREQPVYEPDEWLASVIAAGACDLTTEHGRARVALAAGVIGDADVLRGPLDVRIVLHRAEAFPVVVLLLGSPAGLRRDRRDQIAAMCLDVSAERDRAVLTQLARGFEIVLEVFAGKRWLRRVLLSAPLADNAAYVLRAADDHLHQLGAGGSRLCAERAFQQVSHPGYDITGAQHPDAEHFRDGLLVAVRTAAKLRRALAMAQRFARPEGEDYLVCVRGFPLVRWRRLRRHVLEQAVTWGLWMGPELARVAVSEGMARSRRDLVHRLHDGFALLQAHPTACDLDAAALAENTEALAAEARALGVTPGKARTLFDSEMDSVIAGTIDLPSGPVIPVIEQTLGELVHALEDPPERLAAALEICRRRATSAAQPLVASIARMNRTEAVQLLAGAVRLGEAAEAPLISALASSKAYVRQGAALALGQLRSDDGVAAIVGLLVDEPTEIWKEVARSIGQVGPQGLHHLARTLRERAARPAGQGAGPGAGSVAGPVIDVALEERFAWALALLAARDCHKAVVQMAGGQGAMAPIAARALGQLEPARLDQAALFSDADAGEMTMNRTFSRQFFAAMAAATEAERRDATSDDDDGHFEDNGGEHGSQVIALDDGQRGRRRNLSESEL